MRGYYLKTYMASLNLNALKNIAPSTTPAETTPIETSVMPVETGVNTTVSTEKTSVSRVPKISLMKLKQRDAGESAPSAEQAEIIPTPVIETVATTEQEPISSIPEPAITAGVSDEMDTITSDAAPTSDTVNPATAEVDVSAPEEVVVYEEKTEESPAAAAPR